MIGGCNQVDLAVHGIKRRKPVLYLKWTSIDTLYLIRNKLGPWCQSTLLHFCCCVIPFYLC